METSARLAKKIESIPKELSSGEACAPEQDK
jgi:hypothetical protein